MLNNSLSIAIDNCVCLMLQRWGIYLMDADNQLISADANGVSDAFIVGVASPLETRYQQIGECVDPVWSQNYEI
ncbi:hypothetical protein [Chamaesiphon polymorphus]|uniref:hypothetical protein n=1 Tax=Chamaesiphon polymorphus TaxID=2107691 RepID=UPI0011B222DA|nr:hypothetical protein [Chamaesiphon polymorphus]